MPPFTRIPRLLSRLISSPAFAENTSGTQGWPLFDSRNELPGVMPPLSLRYPPSFRVEAPIHDARKKDIIDAGLACFSRVFRKSRREVLMNVARIPMTPDRLKSEKSVGRKAFWTMMGNEWGSGLGLRFETARTFKTGGLNAVYLLFSGATPKNPEKKSAYAVVHAVIAGKWEYNFPSVCIYPPEETGARDYTPLSNPLFLKFIKPMFESIAFVL
ncbi:MAG: hypothetical protein LBR80_18470 [Deltaproteobacteria bacterium]|nr:hypothetical protein [Deltaproteobacteria bacterium]